MTTHVLTHLQGYITSLTSPLQQLLSFIENISTWKGVKCDFKGHMKKIYSCSFHMTLIKQALVSLINFT